MIVETDFETYVIKSNEEEYDIIVSAIKGLLEKGAETISKDKDLDEAKRKWNFSRSVQWELNILKSLLQVQIGDDWEKAYNSYMEGLAEIIEGR